MWDAFFYMLSQFTGGVLGTVLAFVVLGQTLAHRDVNFAITHPGMRGESVAFIAEVSITFLLMTVILNVSNSRKFARFTGIAAGTLVMLFITFESPLSGMSMNPARSFASDFVGMQWLGTVDLLRRAANRNVFCCRTVCSDTRFPFRDLRQAESLGKRALHLPLRLHGDAWRSVRRLSSSVRGQFQSRGIKKARSRAEERIAVSNDNRYDVIIIGTGAGGGTLAYHLAPSGKRILILERGDYVPREKANWDPKVVNVDAHYNTNESWRDKDGNDLHPHTNYYVGGNTKFYGAALFRLRKQRLRRAAPSRRHLSRRGPSATTSLSLITRRLRTSTTCTVRGVRILPSRGERAISLASSEP